MRAKAPKRGLLDGYATYNPAVEGYGSPDEWKDSFRERIGLNEARETFGASDPLKFFGLPVGATWKEIKVAFRKMAIVWHPDHNRGPDAQAMMRKINAAYTILEDQYRNG